MVGFGIPRIRKMCDEKNLRITRARYSKKFEHGSEIELKNRHENISFALQWDKSRFQSPFIR